jgi:glucose-6-phosphate dehydrogenase assembly protein OpcA
MTILQDTTGAQLLRQLAAERRNDGVASGLALTLIASFDVHRTAEVEAAVTHAAAAHPTRLLLVSRGNIASRYRDRLDAEVIVSGRLGGCEAVIMRMQGRLALHADSVVLPLLAPDVPVVTWWHGPPPERIATDPLGVAADRRITDCVQADDPVAALRQRAADYASGDTDLAWTRLTGWRTLLAAALDGPDGGRPVSRATVTAPRSDASSALLAGWLRARLGVAPRRFDSPSGTLESVALELAGGGSVTVTRDSGSAVLARPGQQDRVVPLLTPTLGELLAEELRRLGADASYADALAAATGVTDLDRRPARRVHLWLDPEEAR